MDNKSLKGLSFRLSDDTAEEQNGLFASEFTRKGESSHIEMLIEEMLN